MIFRAAPPAGPGWNLAKTMIQTAIFWGTLLCLAPWAIVAAEGRLGGAGFPPQRWLGACLFAVASTLGLLSAYTMAVAGEGTPLPLDHPRRLVVTGPYRTVRNPMAVGGIAQGCAVGFLLGSYGVIAYSLMGALVWHFGVRPFEERHLHARFGDAYDAYRRRVRCWIPRRGGLWGSGSSSPDRRGDGGARPSRTSAWCARMRRIHARSSFSVAPRNWWKFSWTLRSASWTTSEGSALPRSSRSRQVPAMSSR